MTVSKNNRSLNKTLLFYDYYYNTRWLST